jgi:hypothetical protein
MLRFMSQVVFLLLVIVSGFWLFSHAQAHRRRSTSRLRFLECGMTKRSLRTQNRGIFQGHRKRQVLKQEEV